MLCGLQPQNGEANSGCSENSVFDGRSASRSMSLLGPNMMSGLVLDKAPAARHEAKITE